ncbi:MAG: phytanoyl-CoA dioxygenase family protein [Anaerolineaceae bacterium]|nr:phytanoyl-CoA dioxygenase family protein [Anaerolineaceae bacterium]
MMLGREQIDFYRERGWLGVEDVLSPQDVEDLRRVTEEFVDKSRHVSANDAVFDLEPGHSFEEPRLRRLKDPIAHHPVYDRIMRHKNIVAIVSQLIGPNIRQNGTKLNMKSPAFGSPVEWHQDWAFYPHTNDDLLAVGVCIDDMTLANGCLLVVPGSQEGPIYDHHHQGAFAGAVTDPNFEPGETDSIEVRAGGISIHHARALHASAPNTSTRPRRFLLFQYCAADAWPLLGPGDLATFDSNMVAGDSSIVPRLADVPVRMPLPPAERPGSIYENQTVLERSSFAMG